MFVTDEIKVLEKTMDLDELNYYLSRHRKYELITSDLINLMIWDGIINFKGSGASRTQLVWCRSTILSNAESNELLTMRVSVAHKATHTTRLVMSSGLVKKLVIVRKLSILERIKKWF